MKAPAGFQVELVAAEPLLANPVAFGFDERGRIYVAETHRVGSGNGVEDNRGHMEWLDDDLAAQTVEDRVAYIKKHLGPRAEAYTKLSERIKLLDDTDGDGKMDAARAFSEGFNGIADGAGAGVLAHRGDVYYTCIPNLWKLRDTDGDGHADERKSLHYGYGVRFAFYGHDLHGLTIGPDGRLYFSIGDRGLNVATADGREVINVDSGAVLRCELDGSKLELFCKGLRNPQELAFDDYGNLFTCDNNSDGGDQARWTYLVEGADYGWRMHYQYLPDRGPWNNEKLWQPQHDAQAAYIVPCIENITDGPSGLTFYPGTGLSDEYRGHFFVCDFRGSAANSCIHTWSQKPKGASFELVGPRKFLEGMLVTDCDFGPDGGLYASDWIEGWNGTGRGRIYRIVPVGARDTRVSEVKKLLADGFDGLATAELVKLLGHADRRVRQGAQFALAEREAIEPLFEEARNGKQVLARVHAVWALGQIARHDADSRTRIGEQLAAVMSDAPSEVAAQVVRAFGNSAALATEGIKHDDAQVRHLAALAVRGDSMEHARALVELLRQNADRDPVIRHSASIGLSRLKNLEQFAGDESPAVRMGVLLAWRRLGEPRIARFLSDVEPRLVLEAGRAIHDLPIDGAMEELASRIDKLFRGSADEYDALFRRALNANFRLGQAEHAVALAEYAGRDDVPEHLRVEAIAMLGDWEKPSPRDRVLGNWRPHDARDPAIAADALRKDLAALFRGPSGVRRAAGLVAAKLEVGEAVPELRTILSDTSNEVSARVAALEAIASLKGLNEVVREALSDPEPTIRNAARKTLAATHPSEALEPLQSALHSGEMIERQAALETLTTLDDGRSDEILCAWLDKLAAGDVAAEMGLDIVLAAQGRLDAKKSAQSDILRERLAKVAPAREATDAASYRLCLVGGDAERGEDVFFDKIAVSCLRCHKIGDKGGDVGPDLTKTGGEKTREYLLEALVEPNKAIAKGFETVVVTLDDGREHSGIVKSESDTELILVTAEAKIIKVETKTIEERTTGQSAMPSDVVKHLTLRELRDLVEFLARQTGESK